MPSLLIHPREPAYVDDIDPRPKPVRAIGVIGGILGALGLLTLPFALIPLNQGSWFSLYETIPGAPRDAAWGLFVWSLLGLLLSLMLFIGSIGCVSWQRWARPVMLIYAVVSIIAGALGTLFFLHWSFGLFGRDGGLLVGVGELTVAVACFLGLIFAAFTLFYMTRGYVKEQFRHAPIPPANPD